MIFLGLGKFVVSSRNFWAGSYAVERDLKAGKVDIILGEQEFIGFWVQYYSIVSTGVEPSDCVKEVVRYCVGPQQDVIDAFCFVWDVGNNLVISPGVSISRCYIALGCGFVSVPTPWGYEGGKMTVLRANRDAVVSIPCIEDSFLLSRRD